MLHTRSSSSSGKDLQTASDIIITKIKEDDKTGRKYTKMVSHLNIRTSRERNGLFRYLITKIHNSTEESKAPRQYRKINCRLHYKPGKK